MKKIFLIVTTFIFLAIAQVPSNALVMPIKLTIKENAVSLASSYIGTRYCRGGESPKCFDCSGFTQYIYEQQGIYLDRRTNTQYKQSKIITRDEAQPGDLVFFLNKNGYAYHVGIYMGNNTILHSPKPGRRVKLETIWSKRVAFATVPE